MNCLWVDKLVDRCSLCTELWPSTWGGDRDFCILFSEDKHPSLQHREQNTGPQPGGAWGRTQPARLKAEPLKVSDLHSNTIGSLKCKDTQRVSLLLRVTSDGKNGNWTLWISLAGHKPHCRQGKMVEVGFSPVGRQPVCWQVSQLSELYQYPWLRDQRRLQ